MTQEPFRFTKPSKSKAPRAKTRSTEEAMDVLRTWRNYLIRYGICVAIQLIKKYGSTNSHAVVSEMNRRGILKGYHGKNLWVGAVFNRGLFKHTGRLISYSDDTRNIHERTIGEWTLKDPQTTVPLFPTDKPTPMRETRSPVEQAYDLALSGVELAPDRKTKAAFQRIVTLLEGQR